MRPDTSTQCRKQPQDKKIVVDDAQLHDIASLPCKMEGLGLLMRAASNLTDIAYKALETDAQQLRTRTYEITKRLGVTTADMTDCDRNVMTSFAKVDTRNCGARTRRSG